MLLMYVMLNYENREADTMGQAELKADERSGEKFTNAKVTQIIN